MPWLDTPTTALCVSVAAFGVNILLWIRVRDYSAYDFLDKAIQDLLKEAVRDPKLRSPSHISAVMLLDIADENRLKYEAYAALYLNTVESAVAKYGKRVTKTHFGPAMRSLTERHKTFYEANKDAYAPISFMYETARQGDAAEHMTMVFPAPPQSRIRRE